MIETANTYFNLGWKEYRTNIIAPLLAKYGIISPKIAEGELKAEINQGRWIVKCECGGAEKAWEEGFFMCQSCLNGNHKHQYRKAVFPKQRRLIESLLLKRPLQNRNWSPNETLAQLKRENEEHREELL